MTDTTTIPDTTVDPSAFQVPCQGRDHCPNPATWIVTPPCGCRHALWCDHCLTVERVEIRVAQRDGFTACAVCRLRVHNLRWEPIR